jgi:hypothetical protein
MSLLSLRIAPDFAKVSMFVSRGVLDLATFVVARRVSAWLADGAFDEVTFAVACEWVDLRFLEAGPVAPPLNTAGKLEVPGISEFLPFGPEAEFDVLPATLAFLFPLTADALPLSVVAGLSEALSAAKGRFLEGRV